MLGLKKNERGDTIIEVMFAMAIIGVVLAAAYATASKNLQTSQLSKERTQATSIAESQLEQLKSIKDLESSSFPASFCVDITSSPAIVDSSPVDDCQETYFKKIITKSDNQYKVVVEWTPPGGSDTNKANVTMYYNDYDYLLSGSSSVSLFTVVPSSGSAVTLGASIRNQTGITETGIVYGVVANPQLNGVGVTPVVSSGTTDENFEAVINGLDSGLVYTARAYATTASGTIYSKPIFINKVVVAPTTAVPVITMSPDTHTTSTAKISGDINDNNSTVTSRTIKYYPNSNPAAAVTLIFNSNNFTVDITFLAPSTAYTYIVEATNGVGTTQSTGSFTTEGITTPNATALGEFDGSTYYFVSDLVSWTEAKARAEALGGHLVTFSSAAENSYVSSKFPQTSWIGLSDSRIESAWEWVTGEPFNYNSWSAGEPNNYQWTTEGQDYALTNWASGNGRWDDQGNNERHGFVVEFDSITPPTSVLGSAYSSCVDSGSPCGTINTSVYSCGNYNVNYSFNSAPSAAYNTVVLNYGGYLCAAWAPTPPNNLYKYNINVYINDQLNVANYQLATNKSIETIPITPPSTGSINSVKIEFTNDRWVTDDSNPYKYDPNFQINNLALGYQ